MELTEDSFRALARSSPWRWASLHFTRHSQPRVEAWVRRPGDLLVREAEGTGTQETFEHGAPYTRSEPGWASLAYLDDDSQPGRAPLPEPFSTLDPRQVTPQLRPDGMVATRPDDIRIVYGDPMWQDYRWVAMLDPAELSSGTRISDLSTTTHRGRPGWRALARAAEAYDPTCGCCPLLRSEISERAEYGDQPGWTPRPDYPDGFWVSLDLQTGIVMALSPFGGQHETLDSIDLEIHDVDTDLDGMFDQPRAQ